MTQEHMAPPETVVTQSHLAYPHPALQLGTPKVQETIRQSELDSLAHPSHPGVWLQLADAYQKTQQFESAHQAARTAVNLAPKLATARILLGKIELQLGLPSAIDILQQTLRDTISDSLKVEGHTLIGEYYRNTHQHTLAYKHYLAANRLRAAMNTVRNLRKSYENPHPEALGNVETWAKTVESAVLRRWPQAPRSADHPEDPIFLLGFPRSGSKVIGQVLANHPKLHLVSEAATVEPTIHTLQSVTSVFPDLSHRSPSELARAKAIYWNSVRNRSLKPIPRGQRLIDPVPLHILRLPVLARIFPNSKFIFALRDPRDACLSCFMHNYRPTAATANFVELQTTARYHAACFKVLHAVQTQLQTPIIETRYENLVTAPRATFVKLLKELQLHEDLALPNQVLYKDSIHRWPHYPTAMREMQPWLNISIDRFNYHESMIQSA